MNLMIMNFYNNNLIYNMFTFGLFNLINIKLNKSINKYMK